MERIRRTSMASLQLATLALASLLLTGCGSTSSVRLDKGLSMETFENLVVLNRRPATIAVIIPEEVRKAVIVQKQGEVTFTLDLGNTLSSKLMQILGYQFERVVLLQNEKSTSPIPWDIRMRVELIESDLQLSTQMGWSTYTMKSGGYISIKGTAVNRSEQVVWVGSARAEGQGESAVGGGGQVPDIQGGLSKAIDIALAQIAAQLTKSESLRSAINETKR